MRAVLQICLLAACLAVALARYKSTDFTDEERMEATRQAVKEAKAYMDEFDKKRTENARIQAESGMTSAQILGKFFRKASPKAEKLGKARLMTEDAVRRAEQLLFEKKRAKMASIASKEKQAEVLAQELFHTPGTLLTKKEYAHISQEAGCEEVHNENIICNPSLTNVFRTYDGTCNNLQRPAEGSSHTAFRRLLPPRYEDGLNKPNGFRQSKRTNDNPFEPPYPSARQVSSIIVSDQPFNDSVHTHLLMQWGQFMDHDLDLAVEFSNVMCDGCESNGVCLPIRIKQDDPAFGLSRRHEGECLEFRRTVPICRDSFEFEPREQINELTHYIDGSMIYGSTETQAKFLRQDGNGLLKEKASGNARNKPSLPEVSARPGNDGFCEIPMEGEQRTSPQDGRCCPIAPRRADNDQPTSCFFAGDVRAIEQVSLTVMHTIWLREHNRVARTLTEMNPGWRNERVYQEARKIVIAEIQHIHYNEYLPALFGQEMYNAMIGSYPGYQSQIDASIPNAFATAAFRFGHSQIQSEFERLDSNFQPIENGHLSLLDSFFNPQEFYDGGGTDPIIRGWITQPARKTDEFLNSILTTHLFETRGGRGMDLASLNIQRSRDHGLPPYTVWRDFCQSRYKGKISSYERISFQNGMTSKRLSETYGSLDTVDLFVGGLAEAPLPGAILGPTFACIFAITFSNLRAGDRFWYERTDGPQALTAEQLAQIKKTSMSRIICDNADNITAIQLNPFLRGNKQRCNSAIPRVSLHPWSVKPVCFYKAQILPHNFGLDLFYSTIPSNLYSLMETNSLTEERCLPFVCPTPSSTSSIAVAAIQVPSSNRRCSVIGNSNLPVTHSGYNNLYAGAIRSWDIRETNGLFGSQPRCEASPNIAVKVVCSRPWALTEELEEELVHILTAEDGSDSKGDTRNTENGGEYLEQADLNDPKILEKIPEVLRSLLRSRAAPYHDQPSNEQPEEINKLDETMKAEESQYNPEREDEKLAHLLEETLEELKNN